MCAGLAISIRAKLGFGVGFVYGDPPFYGQWSATWRGSIEAGGEPVFAGDVRERLGLLSLRSRWLRGRRSKQIYLDTRLRGFLPQELRRSHGARERLLSLIPTKPDSVCRARRGLTPAAGGSVVSRPFRREREMDGASWRCGGPQEVVEG